MSDRIDVARQPGLVIHGPPEGRLKEGTTGIDGRVDAVVVDRTRLLDSSYLNDDNQPMLQG